MFRKILVPTDGSPLSDTAGKAAVSLARGCGAEIVALSIAEPGSPTGRERALELAARRAARIARLAGDAGVPHSELASAGSPEDEEIIRIALERHCDLIFMATHGQGGLTKLIAARVPQLVLAYSPLPVMLYRGSVEPA